MGENVGLGGDTSPATVSNLTTLQHVATTLTLTICVCLHSQPVFDPTWWVRIGAELSDCSTKLLAVPTTAPEFTLKKKSLIISEGAYPKWQANMQKQRRRDIRRRGKSDAGGASCQRCRLVDKNIASISPHSAPQNLTCPNHKPRKTLPNANWKYLQIVPGFYDESASVLLWQKQKHLLQTPEDE